MNFSSVVKNEIVQGKIKKPCCQKAALSAFIRTVGSIEIKSGIVGFSLNADLNILEFFAKIIEKRYNLSPKIIVDKKRKNHGKLLLVSKESLSVLQDLKIFDVLNDELALNLNINNELASQDCCKTGVIKGAFLGSGNVTIPKRDGKSSTGYHLEFTFSNYATANSFCGILSEKGLMPKQVARKESFVVYFKNSEEICDVIAVCGANDAYLALNDLLIEKTVRNDANRARNCVLSNINKTLDASEKCRKDIELIDQTIGLASLDIDLQKVAKERLGNPEASLTELAEILGVTKSSLSRRIKKISEIAKMLN